jgi:hypothetical protein
MNKQDDLIVVEMSASVRDNFYECCGDRMMKKPPTILPERCETPGCHTQLIRVSMKNPYIDDYQDECPACEPGSALKALNSSARAQARLEHE